MCFLQHICFCTYLLVLSTKVEEKFDVSMQCFWKIQLSSNPPKMFLLVSGSLAAQASRSKISLPRWLYSTCISCTQQIDDQSHIQSNFSILTLTNKTSLLLLLIIIMVFLFESARFSGLEQAQLIAWAGSLLNYPQCFLSFIDVHERHLEKQGMIKFEQFQPLIVITQ